MGFHGMKDYFDTPLLVPALSSIEWQVSNALHMLGGLSVAAIGIAFSNNSTNAILQPGKSIALCCGILFFIVGVSGFTALNATHWLADEELRIALTSFIMFRYTLLTSAIASLGIFIAVVGWAGTNSNFFPGWFSYFSYATSIACIAFLFILLPIPLILFIWSAAFGIVLMGA
jgi:hypothetical protein